MTAPRSRRPAFAETKLRLRAGRLKAAFLRLAATILVAVSFSGLAAGEPPGDPPTEVVRRAGVVRRTSEASTTHRAGDLVVYRFACHDADSMIAIAERGGANELAAVLVARGQCFRNASAIAARLEAWVAGPYPPDDGRGARGASGSVWRVADQFGDTEYVWINDFGGRHPARRQTAL